MLTVASRTSATPRAIILRRLILITRSKPDSVLLAVPLRQQW